MNLVITESPTKARFISKILPKSDYKIISCYGRILDLDPINIDEYRNGNSVSWTAINSENIGFIIKESKCSDKIFIATDPDIEGEVIAWQLSMLFKSQNIKTNKILRVNIQELTTKGLGHAFKHPEKLNLDRAFSGIARRIFDNFSRFTFDDETLRNKPYISGSSSRIAAPLLNSISKKPLITHTVKFQRPGMPLPIYLEVNSNQDCQKLCRKLERLPNPVLRTKTKETKQREQEGLDFQGLLLKSLETTKTGEQEIYDTLQNMYVKGKITYFRTDSKNLSDFQKKSIKKEINSIGGSALKFPEYKKTSDVQEGHFGISPLVSINNCLKDFANLSLEDKILSLIWRHYILNTQNRVIESNKGELEINAFENLEWLKVLKEFNGKVQSEMISNHNGAMKEFNEIFKPLGISRDFIKHGQSLSIIQHSRSEALIKRMIDLKLGRPSTLVKHSKKIASKFVRENTEINRRGLSSILENSKISNVLLDIDKAKEIEENLYSLKNNTIDQKINEAIKLLGKENHREGFNRKHRNDFNWGV